MEDWGVSLPLPMPAEVPHTQPTCNTSGAATVKPLSLSTAAAASARPDWGLASRLTEHSLSVALWQLATLITSAVNQL